MPHLDPSTWPPVRRVEDARALDAALERWAACPALGVDTEANSFHAYRERLCLLQVADGADEWLVDPIALGADLRRIAPLFADPRVAKVFHAAEYDLMLLRKELGVEVRGLFDTQVAITLLKRKQTGLAAVLQEIYGLELSKKEQRSDWGRRPLTAEQMAYARADVRFLPDLHKRLAADLESAGLARHAAHEFARLEREVLTPRPPDPERWRKMKGARELDPEGLARLEALFHWRERTAEARDVPPFRILGNEPLLLLAARPPRDVRDLAAVPGIGWNVARKIGDGLMEALGAASGRRVEMAAVPRLSPAERRRRQVERDNLEALRQWRKTRAEALDLPSERLLHRRQLEEVARALPRNSADLGKILSLNDWQRENLEDSLLQVLQSLPDPE
jgi:ribonuclease D